MPDDIYKQLTYLQKQIENLVKPEIMTVTELNDLFLSRASNGRLTLTSATPVLTGSVTAATTIYFTPYLGNRIALYDGSDWPIYSFSEISIAVPSTIYRLFDIFIYDNSGTITLQTVDWNQSPAAITNATNATPIVVTSNGHGLANGDLVAISGVGGNTATNGIWSITGVLTNTFTLEGSAGNGVYTAGGTWYKVNSTRATSLTFQNGRYVKSGDTGKLYLGTGMTTATSGQTEITNSNVLLWNYYNRLSKGILVQDANSHTYTSATIRIYRDVNSNKIGFITGVVEDTPTAIVQADFNFDAGDGTVSTGMSVNRTGTAFNTLLTTVRDVLDARFIADYASVLTISNLSTGYNFFQLLQQGAATSPDFRVGAIRGGVSF